MTKVKAAVGAPVLQVEEEMEELREIYMRGPDEEEEEEQEKQEEGEAGTSSRSPVKKKQVDTCWQATLQRFLTAQELGNAYAHTVPMVTRLSGVWASVQLFLMR